MSEDTAALSPAITESGVRRRKQAFWDWFKRQLLPQFITMAPRKKNEPEVIDTKSMAWRAGVTGALGTIITLLIKLVSVVDNGPLQKSIDNVDRRLAVMEVRLDKVEIKVDAFLDGMKRFPHL